MHFHPAICGWQINTYKYMHGAIIPEGDFKIGPLAQILQRKSKNSTQRVKNTV